MRSPELLPIDNIVLYWINYRYEAIQSIFEGHDESYQKSWEVPFHTAWIRMDWDSRQKLYSLCQEKYFSITPQ